MMNEYIGTLFESKGSNKLNIIVSYNTEYEVYYCYNVIEDYWFSHYKAVVDRCFENKYWTAL